MNENLKYSSQQKKLNELKEEIENLKNPKKDTLKSNNLSNETKLIEEEKKKEEQDKKMIKEKHTLIEKNKTIIENLNKEVEKARSSKKEMENEISRLYDTLSSKFKESQELEKELEIAKENRKKATVEMLKNNINY